MRIKHNLLKIPAIPLLAIFMLCESLLSKRIVQRVIGKLNWIGRKIRPSKYDHL